MLRSKYSNNKVIKRLLATKRKFSIARLEQKQNSRNIILSIFSQETDAQKLEFTKTKWKHFNTNNQAKIKDMSNKVKFQPMRYLFPLLSYIKEGVNIDISDYLIVDGPNLNVVYQEPHIKIVKMKMSASKLKYWLSHLYFSKMKNRLGEDLVEKARNTARGTIHTFEQKEYMPSTIIVGPKKSTPLVRKVQVSPDNRFRRQSQTQKELFCVIYNRAGTEQELSFSQTLAFLDYSFNVQEIIYIKILRKVVKYSLPIQTKYSKLSQTVEDRQIVAQYRAINNRVTGWEDLYSSLQQRKIQFDRTGDYKEYCRQLLLQIVGYLQVKHFCIIKHLDLEWVRDVKQGMILSNVQNFEKMEATTFSQCFDGLETLYKKVGSRNLSTKVYTEAAMAGSSLQYSTSINKRFKSEGVEDKLNFNLSLLPMTTTQKRRPKASSRLDRDSTRLVKNKGKSLALRPPPFLLA